jgi:hypothetical protein
MEQPRLRRRRRNIEFLIWPMRALVVVGVFYIYFKLIFQHHQTTMSLPVGAVLAAAVIVVESYLTARIRARSLRDIWAWRLLVLDHFLARPGDELKVRRHEDETAPAQLPPPLVSTDDFVEGSVWEEEFDEDWPQP